MSVSGLATPLLPRLADVEAALEANGRERKRLFTLRRLIEQSQADAAEPAASKPEAPAIRQPSKLSVSG